MLYWALFVAYQGNKAHSIFFYFFKPYKNKFNKVTENRLDCSYDRTLPNSQMLFACIDWLFIRELQKLPGLTCSLHNLSKVACLTSTQYSMMTSQWGGVSKWGSFSIVHFHLNLHCAVRKLFWWHHIIFVWSNSGACFLFEVLLVTIKLQFGLEHLTAVRHCIVNFFYFPCFYQTLLLL